MRVLGVDLGARRIGLAVSDVEGTVALPVGSLQSHGLTRDVEALAAVVAEREVDCVVVGLPLHMDGRRGPEAEAAERLGKRLADRTGRPVHTLDERWTTRAAARALRSTGRRGRRQRAVVDAVAATLILRSWLEQRSDP